mmetsp:Transcript_8015/g.14989  ORF Transcript_8015/g.14989 Transcript_8015/m.14989 type:complete len:81 (-) Transcript_8015:829-1071(-)
MMNRTASKQERQTAKAAAATAAITASNIAKSCHKSLKQAPCQGRLQATLVHVTPPRHSGLTYAKAMVGSNDLIGNAPNTI